MKTVRVSSRVRTNRTYSLLGTCALLVLTVIQLPRASDLFQQIRFQQSQYAGLLSGELAPARSVELEGELNRLRSECQAHESAMISGVQLPKVQSELMDMAREHGCQLRKSVSQPGETETWNSLRRERMTQDELFDAGESPYQLAVEQLSLTLEGSVEQTFDLLQAVKKQGWLSKVSQVSFARSPERADRLMIEATIAFYKLTKSSPEQSELIQWREGARPANLN